MAAALDCLHNGNPHDEREATTLAKNSSLIALFVGVVSFALIVMSRRPCQ